MSLETSIFLSALLVSLVALFIATKDRWNWKKVILWFSVGATSLALLSGGGLYLYLESAKRPKVQEAFQGIRIGATKADVKFFKGEPGDVVNDEAWLYNQNFLVLFKNGKVWIMIYGCSESPYIYLQGLDCNSDYYTIIDKLGEPSFVKLSEDELDRTLSYKRYKTFFWMKQNRMQGFGIYDPTYKDAVRFPEMIFPEEETQ